MKNSENQKSTREYKVYIHHLKTWVEVTEEQYYAYYRDIWATRKRTQAHGQCMCPKSKTWMCDGDCLACEFRAAGDNLSLDYTVEDGEGNQKSWADDLQDDTLRSEYTRKVYDENAVTCSDEDLAHEIEDRAYVGTEAVSAADYKLGEAWVAITDFLVSAEKITADNAPNVAASINPSYISSSAGVTVAAG